MDNNTSLHLSDRIKEYLNNRGLSDKVLAARNISFNGRIVIPIFDASGKEIFRKYRKDPDSKNSNEPKYSYDPGSKTSLYNIDIAKAWDYVIVTEGELDALVLLSRGFNAVTSTGGAGSFLPDWKPFFEGKKVYVCFDNDSAGRKGLVRVIQIITHALCLPLPEGAKDVTDYFTVLNKTADDFKQLIEHAAFEVEVPPLPDPKPRGVKPRVLNGSDFDKAKGVPISDYLKVNGEGFASCPFHNEKTASLKVDKVNRFYCYGCNKWGDVIDVVQQIYSLTSPREAVNFILKK